MAVEVARRRFNTTEYYQMLEAGILNEDDRVELIEGEIIEMNPIGNRHIACVNRLNALLNQNAGHVAIVSVQNPIHLSGHADPQPDLALLRPREDFYAHALPTPADVLLLIEVADSSVEYDRKVKVPLYAEADIPEVWLVVLPKGLIEVYRQPISGAYQEIRQAKRGESIVAGFVHNLTLSVDAVFG